MSNVKRIGKVSRFKYTRESFPEKLQVAFGKGIGHYCRIIKGLLYELEGL